MAFAVGYYVYTYELGPAGPYTIVLTLDGVTLDAVEVKKL